jgi:hypothetical protein
MQLSYPPWQGRARGASSLPNLQSEKPGGRFRRDLSGRHMPRKRPELVLIIQRIAVARKIVADQQTLITNLKASGQSVVEAEKTLQSYLSSLRHLEDHARKLRAKGK